MNTDLLHKVLGLLLGLSVVLVVTSVFASSQALAVDEDAAERVKSCFEGPAAAYAEQKGGNDTLSRGLTEMAAGKLCAQLAADIVHGCLSSIDAAEDDDGVKDYYPCIGIVANPCIDSGWATNEFREVVCAGTEEQVWLDMLHDKLDKLRAALDGDRKQRFEAMEKGFFALRNDQCGLVRMLREANEPDLAYGACTTEAAARFAIDLQDMVEAVENAGKQPASAETGAGSGEQTRASEETTPQQETAQSEGAAELGSKAAPVKADNPAGEHAYLRRLRCPDGSPPSYSRQGSMGYGGYGHIVDLYSVQCESSGQSHEIYMDMDFPGYVETRPVAGFTIADE